MKLALMGPPHTGKSCFKAALKTAFGRLPARPYLYVIDATADGEGAWYHETAARHPDLARSLKERKRKPYTWKFADWAAGSVRDCGERYVLIDTGGMITLMNCLVWAFASHALLLHKDPASLEDWRAVCRHLRLPIFAEIESDLHATADRIDGVGPDGVFRGLVRNLDRRSLDLDRPLVSKFANYFKNAADRVEPRYSRGAGA